VSTDARIERRSALVLALAAVAIGGCDRPQPFDPAAHAATVIAECSEDSSCVRERWRRDPRAWNVGLRAEVAGRRPQGLLVVETVREIVSPELRGAPCLADVTSAGGFYFRTWVAAKRSGEYPFAVFHWQSFDEAAAGHRAVVAAVADARGDDERLWGAVEHAPALDRACARFRGRRDRCEATPATG
jgi:hypothetical protein